MWCWSRWNWCTANTFKTVLKTLRLHMVDWVVVGAKELAATVMIGPWRRADANGGSWRQSYGWSLCDSPSEQCSQEMRWRKVMLVVASVALGQHMAMSFAQAPALTTHNLGSSDAKVKWIPELPVYLYTNDSRRQQTAAESTTVLWCYRLVCDHLTRNEMMI